MREKRGERGNNVFAHAIVIIVRAVIMCGIHVIL